MTYNPDYPEPDFKQVRPTRGETVQGALFDFMGYLTTREGTLELGATHTPGDLLNHWEDWCATRNLKGFHADVLGWRDQNLAEGMIDILLEQKKEKKKGKNEIARSRVPTGYILPR